MTEELASRRPKSPAVARNRDAILKVLQHELAPSRRVLEIGSGTGEHAIFFAKAMSQLEWQCSDRRENHEGILRWLEFAGLSNVQKPLDVDVDAPPSLPRTYDAVFSANTAHIMNERQVRAMFALVGQVLETGGRFCLYGPFRIDGEFTSQSNARFDASLRAQKASMGIRELQDLDRYALAAALTRRALYAMPANNFIAVWERGDGSQVPSEGEDL